VQISISAKAECITEIYLLLSSETKTKPIVVRHTRIPGYIGPLFSPPGKLAQWAICSCTTNTDAA